MERRYEAYKSIVVKPFFSEHFARLDRQIVLIDALQAVNRGPGRSGSGTGVGRCPCLFSAPARIACCRHSSVRIDKVLVAATKADHLHHESHDRLESLTARLVDRAVTTIA